MNWLFEFPFVAKPDVNAIDKATRSFAADASWFFEDIIGAGLTSFVNGINSLLNYIPWIVLIALVFALGGKARGKFTSGILYAAMLFFIGVVGLWELMLMTLSIVIASVIIALVLGFPLGILISGSERANNIVRPIMDTMQTMPVFVYLIPALLFFGMGSASAVIATVIYAIVPVIRLTSLGIRQVDTEVVEAAKAFGSTRMQALIKVQIPQAMPTIMTGVNQTLMMAMAMVVTCSMIGARGLGNEVLIAVNRTEIGRGLISGISVVILAVLLDRLTQGWHGNNKKTEPKERRFLSFPKLTLKKAQKSAAAQKGDEQNA
ncbi:MAG: ABC transporter permease [Christensenellales bacterium]|jgi:ABC-type proline/glycine betaine transport system permease subunit